MAFRPQDGPIFVKDGEQAVLAGGTAKFKCVLEYPEDVNLFGGQSKVGQVTAKPSMVYCTADPGRTLLHGDSLTVDGVAYTVRYVRKLGDGTMSMADLQEKS